LAGTGSQIFSCNEHFDTESPPIKLACKIISCNIISLRFALVAFLTVWFSYSSSEKLNVHTVPVTPLAWMIASDYHDVKCFST